MTDFSDPQEQKDEGVCITALAIPGLYNIREDQIRTYPIIGGMSFTPRKYYRGPDQNIAYYWEGRVSHLENIREDQIRTKPIIGDGEDQF